MISLVMLRHGPTAWNAEKRIQGRSDIALSDKGRQVVGGWRLDSEFKDYDCVTSPLIRARETAQILGLEPNRSEPLLIEMNWGEWEGRILPELRSELGAEMAANEKRGLDFQPPGGESPRDIQSRLGDWLATLQKPTIAVSHKGIIRALYALASGWDMTHDPAQKLRDGTAHSFLIDGDGNPSIDRLNMPL